MKISLNWLRELSCIPTKIEYIEIQNKLITSGLEVEFTNENDLNLKSFFLFYILSKKKHNKKKNIAIYRICNRFTSFFLITLNFPTFNSKLNLSFFSIYKYSLNNLYFIHDKFYVLNNTDQYKSLAYLGKSLRCIKGSKDYIFNISITQNLSHTMNHIGLSYEIAALYNTISIKYLPHSINRIKKLDNEIIGFTEKYCNIYGYSILTNIIIKPSPLWLKIKLESCGIESKNNIIDISNLIMLENGQPLNIYDFSRINVYKKNKITISTLKGKHILDKNIQNLSGNILNVSWNNIPLSVSGIYGNKYFNVNKHTNTIFVESAVWNPHFIRKNSKICKIKSNKSVRFDKLIDSHYCLISLSRFIYLVNKLCKSNIIHSDYKDNLNNKKILNFNFHDISQISGLMNHSSVYNSIKEKLLNLGYRVINKKEFIYSVEVPSFRSHIKRSIDLTEDIIRILSYNVFPKKKKKRILI